MEFTLASSPSDSAKDNSASTQSPETSHSQPDHVPSQSNRKELKPTRWDASLSRSDAQIERLPPIRIVSSDPAGPSSSSQKEKPGIKGSKTPVQRSLAMIRAEELQRGLGTEFPCCIKIMHKSQVTSGFWLGLPLHFCKTYLPQEDTTILLEDENGENFDVKYIAYKIGLSAGWKNFALRHNLMEEDVLIFQLVEATKFKVYILKANDSSEAAYALTLLNSEAHTEQTTPVTVSPKTKKNKHPESDSPTLSQKKHKQSGPTSTIPPNGHCSRNDGEVGGSEVPECSRSSDASLPLQQVIALQDFHIMVRDLCIDSEVPNDVRTGYYKLCLYKKELLHDDLPEGLYYKLVAGMIGQTVSIANEIRNCKLAKPKEAFESWDNSLRSFELLGMKVGFLRDKILKLEALVFESDIQRYVEAKTEHKRAEDEIQKVEAKLKELKESAEKFDGIVGCLKQKVEQCEHKFQKEVDALE